MSLLGGRNATSFPVGPLTDDRFPDPFCDAASTAMPETIYDALRWSEFVIMANGVYRAAVARVIAYFITDIEIVAPGGGDGSDRLGREEKQKYLDFLNDTLGIKNVLSTVALDLLTYGNSFTSLIVPFRRYLSCPGCGLELPLKRVFNTPDFKFQWSGYQFHAQCPQCNYTGIWKHIDRRSGASGQIKVKRWSPHEMDILHDPYTDDTAYIWRIPDDYRSLLKQGHLHQLERASWELVEAVRGNQALLFDPDVIYHMKEESLAGIRNRGWGISRVLANFRQAWYVQVLHRYNEAIALDYVIPFRVITPQPRPGQGGEVNDPVLQINMGSFASRVERMLKQRRRDPARWNILPFPIEYQALGGDATQLAPKDLLELGYDTLLTSIGVPVELYKGSLQVQAAPAALRLFEANWSYLVHSLNRFLAKLVEKVAQVMSWEPVNCRLQRVTHADDLNRQMAKLQLMMGGQISRTTGLSSVGLDFSDEERRKLEEERISAEATQDMQKEMEQSARMDEMTAAQGDPSQGAMPPAGDPSQGGAMAGPAGQPMQPMGPMGQPAGPYGASQSFAANQPLIPNKPTTPDEMISAADTLAQQAMSMAETQRRSFLIKLRKEDQVMHSLVTSRLEDMRREARNQGGEMVMAQQYGKQAAATSLSIRDLSNTIRLRPATPDLSSTRVSSILAD